MTALVMLMEIATAQPSYTATATTMPTEIGTATAAAATIADIVGAHLMANTAIQTTAGTRVIVEARRTPRWTWGGDDERPE